MSRRKNCVFIGGLPAGVEEKSVRDYFKKFGEIRSVTLNKTKQETREGGLTQVMKEKNTNFDQIPNNHRGCGFVEFASNYSVRAATQTREHYLLGAKIDCRVAMTNNERKNYQKSIMKERRKVFIGKLPPGVTRETLYDYFVQFSDIEEITLIFKPDKSFGISFILFRKPFVGDQLLNRSFEILPGVVVECELALNPQQLHERKLQEMNHMDVLPQIEEDDYQQVKFESEFPEEMNALPQPKRCEELLEPEDSESSLCSFQKEEERTSKRNLNHQQHCHSYKTKEGEEASERFRSKQGSVRVLEELFGLPQQLKPTTSSSSKAIIRSEDQRLMHFTTVNKQIHRPRLSNDFSMGDSEGIPTLLQSPSGHEGGARHRHMAEKPSILNDRWMKFKLGRFGVGSRPHAYRLFH